MKSLTESFANNTTKPIWVSPKEAKRLTSFGLTRLYELIDDGALKSIKVGRKRLISYDSLEALGDRP